MSYIEQSDVEQRLRDNLAALYNLPTEQGDLDADIASAEALVDSYLGRRYAVPVTSNEAQNVLKVLSLALFEELAWSRAIGEELPKKVWDAANTARKQLEQISRGEISLAGADVTESAGGSSSAVAVVSGNDPEFTRQKMEGF